MNQLFSWFESNRRILGTSVGVLDILLGLSYLIAGNVAIATMWTCIGIFILIDAWKE